MPDVMMGALCGIVALTIVNIVVISFSYGRMTEKVNQLCQRVDKLEKRIFNGGK